MPSFFVSNFQWFKVKLIYLDLLKTVKFLHSRKVMQGDLTLNNIFVTSTFKIKLLDFRYSCLITSKSQFISNYSGSILYLSPEVVGKKPFNGGRD